MKHEGKVDKTDEQKNSDEVEELEEGKPPRHIHSFLWYQKPTDLLRVLFHFNSCMPGYMEESNDCGTGLKGMFQFEPNKNGVKDTRPTYAGKYCGIHDAHEPDSHAEVIRYKRTIGDSAYASDCGHMKVADQTPEIFGFDEGAFFAIDSAKADMVVKLFGHKYLCFDYDLLLSRMSPTDLLLYEECVEKNSKYDAESKAPRDLRSYQKLLTAKRLLYIEPIADKIHRYASYAFEQYGSEHGPFYNAIEGVFDNSPAVNRYQLALDVYTMPLYGPSKTRRIPFLYGPSNSGKSTLFKGIKKLFHGAFAVPVKNDPKYFYGNLKGGHKTVFIWDDFYMPGYGDYAEMLNAFEGEEGHVYRCMSAIETPSAPIKYFVTSPDLLTLRVRKRRKKSKRPIKRRKKAFRSIRRKRRRSGLRTKRKPIIFTIDSQSMGPFRSSQSSPMSGIIPARTSFASGSC
jgi:hypothetical protein